MLMILVKVFNYNMKTLFTFFSIIFIYSLNLHAEEQRPSESRFGFVEMTELQARITVIKSLSKLKLIQVEVLQSLQESSEKFVGLTSEELDEDSASILAECVTRQEFISKQIELLEEELSGYVTIKKKTELGSFLDKMRESNVSDDFRLQALRIKKNDFFKALVVGHALVRKLHELEGELLPTK